MAHQLKYKAGDRVKVREDLKEGEYYPMEFPIQDRNIVTYQMEKFRGKEVTIERVTKYNEYRIYGSNHNWTDGCLKEKSIKYSMDWRCNFVCI